MNERFNHNTKADEVRGRCESRVRRRKKVRGKKKR